MLNNMHIYQEQNIRICVANSMGCGNHYSLILIFKEIVSKKLYFFMILNVKKCLHSIHIYSRLYIQVKVNILYYTLNL